ncbi:DNA repair protein rad16 [Coemansia sp. RSA 1933]|nr:DNA repair protein rad16 [Coemansia sp. RSA 1933]
MNKDERTKYDVVLTSYDVMECGYQWERTGFRSKGVLRKEPSVLHHIKWFRVVLDKAHNIKDRSSSPSRARFALKMQHMWVITGMLLHNHVKELFSLVRLTKADPFSNYFCYSCECSLLYWNVLPGRSHCYMCRHKKEWHFCYWNMHILKSIQLHSTAPRETRMAFRKLNALLDNLMLRRTKVDCTRDLGLLPRIVVTRRNRFILAEEEARDGTILNNYANIFELITRMRLTVNHPDLLNLNVDAKNRIGSDVTDTLVCPICNEEAEGPIQSSCKHLFCRVDAYMYVASIRNEVKDKIQCPMCFKMCSIDLDQPEMSMSIKILERRADGSGTTFMETMMSTPDTTEYKWSIINRIDMKNWKSSTKIETLVEELSKHRRSNSNIKSIVFSQFFNFLDQPKC